MRHLRANWDDIHDVIMRFHLEDPGLKGLAEGWATTVPFRTLIRGSDRAEFPERGIFTGKVADQSGNPVGGARLILIPAERTDSRPDTSYTNRV